MQLLSSSVETQRKMANIASNDKVYDGDYDVDVILATWV